MTIDRTTVDAMARAGIDFAVNFRAPGGGRNELIGAEDVELFVTDPDAAAAKHYGVSKELYRDWVESDGSIQCSGITVSGQRCKNHLSGAGQRDIKEWLSMP